MEILFISAFCWLGISILESVNPPLSFSKWGVFLFFLLFCASYSNLLKNREDLVLTLFPFIVFFVVFVWMTLISARFYPQPLKSSVGYINGFLIFAPAVGHFLTAFGTPGILYILAHSLGKKMRIFLIITLFLGVFLTIYSGSRAGTFTTFFILGMALIKWRRERSFAFLKVTVFCIALFFIIVSPRVDEQFLQFLYKYPDESEIFASRKDFWQRTVDSFEERPLWGFGFGVQKQHADQPVGFFTIGFREQGSTFLGLLEEVGLVGALPMFLFFGIIGYKALLSVWRSSDPLDVFLSRVIVAGMSLAAIENYLLYLGNATSILVFLAFFLRERWKGMLMDEIIRDSPPKNGDQKRSEWKTVETVDCPAKLADSLGSGSKP